MDLEVLLLCFLLELGVDSSLIDVIVWLGCIVDHFAFLSLPFD